MIGSVGLLVLIFLTIGVWIVRPDLGRKMAWAGTFSLPILLIKPLTSIGFFNAVSAGELVSFFLTRALVSFSFAALAAAAYEVLLQKHFVKTSGQNRHHLIWLIAGPIIFLLSYFAFELSLVVCLLISLLVNILILIIYRRDLIWDALFSALLTSVLYIGLYLINFNSVPGDLTRLWFSSQLTGLTFFGLPIEELFTVGLFGAFWGPLFITLNGRKEK